MNPRFSEKNQTKFTLRHNKRKTHSVPSFFKHMCTDQTCLFLVFSKISVYIHIFFSSPLHVSSVGSVHQYKNTSHFTITESRTVKLNFTRQQNVMWAREGNKLWLCTFLTHCLWLLSSCRSNADCLQQRCAKPNGPQKSKTSTVWPFIGKVCQFIKVDRAGILGNSIQSVLLSTRMWKRIKWGKVPCCVFLAWIRSATACVVD